MALSPAEIAELQKRIAANSAASGLASSPALASPGMDAPTLGAPAPIVDASLVAPKVGYAAAKPVDLGLGKPAPPPMAFASGAPTIAGMEAVMVPEAKKKAMAESALAQLQLGKKPGYDPATGLFTLAPNMPAAIAAVSGGGVGLAGAPGKVAPKGYGGGGGGTSEEGSLITKNMTGGEIHALADTIKAQKENAALGKDEADLSAKGLGEQASIMQDAMDRDQRMALEAKSAEERRQFEASKELEKLKLDSASLAETKFDPDLMWEQKGAGARVAAILGGALLGYAGKGQTAIATVQAEIDRSLMAQKANFDAKKTALGQKESLYGRQMQLFGDQRMAEQGARMQAWQQADREMQQHAMTIGGEKAALAAQQFSAQAKQKIVEIQDQFVLSAEQRQKQKDAQAAAAAAGYANAQKKRDEQLFGVGLEGLKVAQNELAKQGIPTKPGIGKDGLPVLLDITGKPIAGWDPASSGNGAPQVKLYQGTNEKGEPVFGGAATTTTPRAAGAYAGDMKVVAENDALFARIDQLRKTYGNEYIPGYDTDASKEAKAIVDRLNANGLAVPKGYDPLAFSNDWSVIEDAKKDNAAKKIAAEQLYLKNGPSPLSLGKPVAPNAGKDDDED